jgi:hypothetical protein
LFGVGPKRIDQAVGLVVKEPGADQGESQRTVTVDPATANDAPSCRREPHGGEVASDEVGAC